MSQGQNQTLSELWWNFEPKTLPNLVVLHCHVFLTLFCAGWKFEIERKREKNKKYKETMRKREMTESRILVLSLLFSFSPSLIHIFQHFFCTRYCYRCCSYVTNFFEFDTKWPRSEYQDFLPYNYMRKQENEHNYFRFRYPFLFLKNVNLSLPNASPQNGSEKCWTIWGNNFIGKMVS